MHNNFPHINDVCTVIIMHSDILHMTLVQIEGDKITITKHWCWFQNLMNNETISNNLQAVRQNEQSFVFGINFAFHCVCVPWSRILFRFFYQCSKALLHKFSVDKCWTLLIER